LGERFPDTEEVTSSSLGPPTQVDGHDGRSEVVAFGL
jgi:hypothetical protein